MRFLAQAEDVMSEYERMRIYNNEFWEHLADHFQMAFAFLVLGMILTVWIITHLHNKKYRIDYDLECGTIMRQFIKGEKWLIVNPRTTLQWLDVLLLIFFDKGKTKDQLIDKHDQKRIRNISIFMMALITFVVVGGFIMIFSASAVDLNPYNWLRGYRPWK
ncbi:hypothetical protein [Viridibacillus arvi]|uniref:hypothetical protein n=1 Tax=Viridibacillus arvi TaxID=263475 RepID=UPI0034CEAB55